MTGLKLGPIMDDKPVRLTVEVPPVLMADLCLYGELLAEGGPPIVPAKLVVPMLERFIATDRAFARARKGNQKRNVAPA
jgi:hypothetical protein